MSSSSRSTTRTTKKKCDCGKLAPLCVAKTNENPGRRFWGCYNYRRESEMCEYFVWKDDELCHHYKHVILVAWNSLERLTRENHDYENRVALLENSLKDANDKLIRMELKEFTFDKKIDEAKTEHMLNLNALKQWEEKNVAKERELDEIAANLESLVVKNRGKK